MTDFLKTLMPEEEILFDDEGLEIHSHLYIAEILVELNLHTFIIEHNSYWASQPIEFCFLAVFEGKILRDSAVLSSSFMIFRRKN